MITQTWCQAYYFQVLHFASTALVPCNVSWLHAETPHPATVLQSGQGKGARATGAWGAQGTRYCRRPAPETREHSCKEISEAKYTQQKFVSRDYAQSRNGGLPEAQHVPSALTQRNTL